MAQQVLREMVSVAPQPVFGNWLCLAKVGMWPLSRAVEGELWQMESGWACADSLGPVPGSQEKQLERALDMGSYASPLTLVTHVESYQTCIKYLSVFQAFPKNHFIFLSRSPPGGRIPTPLYR